MNQHKNNSVNRRNMASSKTMSDSNAMDDQETTSSPPTVVSRKRKADVLGRLEQSSMTHQGRGALVGWTTCPLCGRFSKKRYALGRGISAHLHAVHSPWNPGKAERKKRRLIVEQQEWNKRRKKEKGGDSSSSKEVNQVEEIKTWEPTEKERQEWNDQVLKITTELETKAAAATETNDSSSTFSKGLDRNGKVAVDYRTSLPPFIKAAANGDLEVLKQMMSNDSSEKASELLTTRDRNGSTAANWAAGNGHLECLKYLLKLQQEHKKTTSEPKKKVRRRDGKSCLHYAARNGHLECIRYLIDNKYEQADTVSGDGTTPLHMACFGGNIKAIQLLLSTEYKANIHAVNDWNCGVAHWIGMTKCQSKETVWEICQLLQQEGVDFCVLQKQKHSILHKAAQRGNRHVIEWMDSQEAGLTMLQKQQVGQPDDGGHKPSDIWRCVGGEASFGEWMHKQGW